MAINATYYIDAATFDVATSVYLDTNLEFIAPDGVYRFGVITRQQSSGILLTVEDCATCSTPCGGTVISGSGGTGLNVINVNAGSTLLDVGAIIISFNPFSIPDGIRVTYDGVEYNKVSNSTYGVLQSINYGNFTMLGSTGSVGSCSTWYPSGGTNNYQEKVFNGTSFVATGNYIPVTIDTGDIQLTATSPSNVIMVIPKPNATPNLLKVEILGPCSTTGWNITIPCPVLLPSFASSDLSLSASISCIASMPNTFYFAKVHTAVDSYVGLYDYVFTDANGEFPLADGYYMTSNVAVPNQVLQIVNGVVVAITNCI